MALFYLARSQQYEGKYKEAIKNYQAYLETNPQSSLAKNGIRGCNLAQQWKKTPTRYIVKKATMFNSRRSFRFFIEFLKENQEDFENSMMFNMGQWLSVPFIIIGVYFMFFYDKKKKKIA